MLYIALMVFGGCLVALQSPVNAALSRTVGILESSFVSFAGGTLFLGLAVLFFGRGQLLRLTEAPSWQWIGGVFGAIMVLNSVIAGMAPFWMTAFSILNVVLWVTSGVMFVPDALPKAAQDILAYHPVLHAVEWMRAAYFEGYGASILDKKYLLWFGVGLLFAGLVGERIMRGGILGR